MARARTLAGWYRKNVHRVRAVVAFVLYNLVASGADAITTWNTRRFLVGVAVALVFYMRAGDFQPPAPTPPPEPPKV